MKITSLCFSPNENSHISFLPCTYLTDLIDDWQRAELDDFSSYCPQLVTTQEVWKHRKDMGLRLGGMTTNNLCLDLIKTIH